MNTKTPKKLNTGILLAAAAMMALSACGSMKKELGVGRNSPDEFAVVKRAPLSMPPDYALRPPSEGLAPPASEASSQARTALMGQRSPTTSARGGAEAELMRKMGADSANPEIRAIIAQDNGYLAIQNKPLVDKLIFWSDEEPTDTKVPGSTVNARAEAERIKKNQQEGKPINDGDVPVIERNQGALGKIF